MKRKDMVLRCFLSRVPEDVSDPLEIIPISFNMLENLKERYYNIHVSEIGKYMIQTRNASQANGVKLLPVHATDTGVNPNLKTRKIK